MAWWEDIPLKIPTKIGPDKLSFDRNNPRYSAEDGQPYSTERQIVRYLDQTADLGELLQSVSTSGYLDVEPLIVAGQDDDLVVLEGNRRLAAIKLLSDPAFADECGVLAPSIDEKVRKTLEQITVYRVEDRNSARDFIGFKHINGAHRWDSVAKARYATSWYKEERAKGEQGLTLQDIARRMGDRHATLQRMVSGMLALDQAKSEQLFDTADRWGERPFAFSHFYTALQRPGYRKYLGLGPDIRSSDPEENPVPADSLPRLRQVLLWLYGSKRDNVKPVIESQNPDIKNLGEVLDSPRARKIMLETGSLERSVSELVPPVSQFENVIVELHQNSKTAASLLTAYDGGDPALTELVDEVSKNVRLILAQMKALDENPGLNADE